MRKKISRVTSYSISVTEHNSRDGGFGALHPLSTLIFPAISSSHSPAFCSEKRKRPRFSGPVDLLGCFRSFALSFYFLGCRRTLSTPARRKAIQSKREFLAKEIQVEPIHIHFYSIFLYLHLSTHQTSKSTPAHLPHPLSIRFEEEATGERRAERERKRGAGYAVCACPTPGALSFAVHSHQQQQH